MSNHYQRYLSLGGLNLAAYDRQSLGDLARQTLARRIHGLCFSPYLPGQGPGTEVSATQIRERLELIRPWTRWVRTFSCTDGLEQIAPIAAEMGLKSMVGVWLDEDLERNELELENALAVAAAGHAGILAVGNEVLLRDELPEATLIDYLERARKGACGVPVGYVDAYFKFVDHPEVTAACDVVLANCYPFWEGCPADYALPYMKDMYRRACQAADGKKVIISETGWPDVGSPTGGAQPSPDAALKYFLDVVQWCEDDAIELFYFSAFDEAWKVDAEGDVGAYWGLLDQDGRPKHFDPESPPATTQAI